MEDNFNDSKRYLIPKLETTALVANAHKRHK